MKTTHQQDYFFLRSCASTQKEQQSRHSMKNSFLGGKVWDKFQEKLQDHVQAGGGYHDHDGAMIATVVDDVVWEMDYDGDVKWMMRRWISWSTRNIFWWNVLFSPLCVQMFTEEIQICSEPLEKFCSNTTVAFSSPLSPPLSSLSSPSS